MFRYRVLISFMHLIFMGDFFAALSLQLSLKIFNSTLNADFVSDMFSS
jgi:hypothetical protein